MFVLSFSRGIVRAFGSALVAELSGVALVAALWVRASPGARLGNCYFLAIVFILVVVVVLVFLFLTVKNAVYSVKNLVISTKLLLMVN